MAPELKYRTFWPRFWSGMIDMAVFWPFLLVIDDWVWSTPSHPVLLVLWFLFYSVALTAYSILCHGLWGQTLGKRLLRIRVLDVSGGRLTFPQAVLRDAFPLAFAAASLAIDLPVVASGQNPYDEARIAREGLPWLSELFGYLSLAWFVAEFVTMLFNDKRRAIHDYIASSVVVRTTATSALPK
jgi:uncharacterized RDD family membrane protein YckC